jgi:hypothetical protein
MIVEDISNKENLTDVVDSDYVCKIELTLQEARAILHSLGRTMCRGDELTISMELEDKLVDVIKRYW